MNTENELHKHNGILDDKKKKRKKCYNCDNMDGTKIIISKTSQPNKHNIT